MALVGTAFLALWNDVARAREPEYDRWHTREHVPERVAVTGFRGARRYVNRARHDHRYFTLYDVDDLGVFDSPEYADLGAHPTPWSASMRPDFLNVVRVPCRILESSGAGIGAALAVVCYVHAQAGGAPFPRAEIDALPGATACHLGAGHSGAPASPWTMPEADATAVRPFDRVALVEALDRDAAAGALAAARAALGLSSLAPDFGCDVFDLSFVFPGPDRDEPRRHRRPQWR